MAIFEVRKERDWTLFESVCFNGQNSIWQCVKVTRTDNGLEFKLGPMKNFYAEKGILHQTSCVDTPQ